MSGAVLARVIERAAAAPGGRARLTQVGRMWRAPGARPLAFSATQTIDLGAPAFEWRARFRVAPGLSLEVVDAVDAAGRGRLEGRLWGWLRLFRSVSADVDRGEIYRYLAELPWAPGAYLGNPALAWEQVAPSTLSVTCDAPGGPARVFLEVDAVGRVVGVRAEDRPREVRGGFEPCAWAGRFGAWHRFGGVEIPTEGEVAWETPQGPFTYWRGRVTGYEVEPLR